VKLFVANVAWRTLEDKLREVFGQFGHVVSCRIIQDRESGRSRGFGFVEFASSAQAEAATKALDGADIDGREIHIERAREK
jgi:RNA recognition motif-containing protein